MVSVYIVYDYDGTPLVAYSNEDAAKQHCAISPQRLAYDEIRLKDKFNGEESEALESSM